MATTAWHGGHVHHDMVAMYSMARWPQHGMVAMYTMTWWPRTACHDGHSIASHQPEVHKGCLLPHKTPQIIKPICRDNPITCWEGCKSVAWAWWNTKVISLTCKVVATLTETSTSQSWPNYSMSCHSPEKCWACNTDNAQLPISPPALPPPSPLQFPRQILQWRTINTSGRHAGAVGTEEKAFTACSKYTKRE